MQSYIRMLAYNYVVKTDARWEYPTNSKCIYEFTMYQIINILYSC